MGGSARDPLPPSNHTAAEGFSQLPVPMATSSYLAEGLSCLSDLYSADMGSHAAPGTCPGEKEALRGNMLMQQWQGQPAQSLDQRYRLSPCN